jgi:predicted NBD/HSP70 family sugar kinase
LILLGLDPRPSNTVAVLVDEHGRVLSRSTHESLDSARGSTHQGQPPASVGVVVHNGVEDAPSAAVNPASAIALAEAWTGAAKDARFIVAVTLEQSIQAGIVIEGRLFRGAHEMAGAIGWLSLNPVERIDYRKLGCLQAEVGPVGIVRRLVWRIKSGDRSDVEEMAGGDLNAITLEHIFTAARRGDGVAEAVMRDTARYIGMALANLVVVLDPEIVVLGGTIGEAGDLLLGPAASEMTRRLPPGAGGRVNLVKAALGQDAAAIGAARAALLATRAA